MFWCTPPSLQKIRIDVAASAEERGAWEPWLLALVHEMVPITARVELRWVAEHGLRGMRIDDELVLEDDPLATLGSDAVTGRVRLPEGPSTLSRSGPEAGVRLH